MNTAFVIVTILAAAWVGYSAAAVFFRTGWVVEALTDYGVPESWWPWLGAAKAAGAAGLLVGLFVPVIGVLATIGLFLYFAGAVIAVIRARSYAHIPFPLLYLAPVLVAAALGYAAA
ncbi:energy-coupling factor transporter transmembrane protein EcfT [Rhodococcus sp. PvR044]|uniref:DoxX family protein n=1 Tax=Rhodococcus sp. PvR044 TaxID=3156402 RepID=UPI003395F4ED